MSEWMVSVDVETGELAEEQQRRVLEELERLVWDPPLATLPAGLGSTFTVWAPTRELAETRGRHLFEAALRLAGVPGEVVEVEAVTYDEPAPV